MLFLDEVTALAAGHRPCFFCRREQATDFLVRFGRAFAIEAPRAPMVDELLHRERVASGGLPRALSLPELDHLPDGVVVADESKAYALRCGLALEWSFAGYGKPIAFDRLAVQPLRLLTPAATVAVLRQGFAPIWQPSADTARPL